MILTRTLLCYGNYKNWDDEDYLSDLSCESGTGNIIDEIGDGEYI